MGPLLLSITGDRPTYVGKRGWLKRFVKKAAKIYTAPARFAFKAATHYTPQAIVARQAVKLFKRKRRGAPAPRPATPAPVMAPVMAPARTITPAEIEQVKKEPVGPGPEESAPGEEAAPAETPAEETADEDETEDQDAEE